MQQKEEKTEEKPIDPNGGQLVCWKCKVPFGRRQSSNRFSYHTNNKGQRTGIEVEVMPTGGVAQYRFTCNNCRAGQIYVSVGGNSKISDEEAGRK